MIRILNLSKEPNPVGEAKSVDAVQQQVLALADQWDEQLESHESHWYHFAMPWKWKKSSMFQVTDFLLRSLDELIKVVDEHVEFGPDKKATVLDAIDKLYEYVIKEALPVWLKPFGARVREYIIYTLISTTIDWIIDKYRNGEWREDLKEELAN